MWVPQSASAGGIIPDKYDNLFKESAIHLPAGTDWRLVKAQCWQESRLNPLAVSPVGAMGLCQFMPGTADDMGKRYSYLEGSDFWRPDVSILAANLYMAELNRFWSAPRPVLDRYKLALASYNAGPGNLLSAQKLSGGENGYAEIISYLPDVTGRHSSETIQYVDLIVYKWYVVAVFG